ncbi:MAG: hypothetical protein HY064_05325 [Bacteroidetes bacterium]|nr:hypothetical protein [Bacteroidota bacterium]
MFSTNIPAQDLCNEKTAGAEQGLCGKINGQNIYYEVWLEFDAGGFRKNVLFLRTDTIDISDSVSFCVDNIFGGNEEHGDSIGVSMTVNDTAKEFYTMNANDIPTVVQILDFHYGNEEYGGFNQGGSGYSIKIKGKKLYLTTLSSSSKYDATFEVKRKYKYRNGIFVPARTRYRKISDGYTLTGE